MDPFSKLSMLNIHHFINYPNEIPKEFLNSVPKHQSIYSRRPSNMIYFAHGLSLTMLYLGVDNICSRFLKCLMKLPFPVNQVILYSDSCLGQKKKKYSHFYATSDNGFEGSSKYLILNFFVVAIAIRMDESVRLMTSIRVVACEKFREYASHISNIIWSCNLIFSNQAPSARNTPDFLRCNLLRQRKVPKEEFPLLIRDIGAFWTWHNLDLKTKPCSYPYLMSRPCLAPELICGAISATALPRQLIRPSEQ